MIGNDIVALDLFSGPGGMSLGLARAGFTMAAAVDSERHAERTYTRNSHHNRGARFVLADLSLASSADLLRQIGVGRSDIALLAGGPPCKGFSSANMRTRNGQNPHNRLVDDFFRIAVEIRPQIFVMENVMGLVWFNEDFLQQCEHFTRLASLGYEIDLLRTNALHYGVPQNRERLLVIGNRLGRRPSGPRPTHGQGLGKPTVTLGEAIVGDLPPLKGEAGSQVCDYISEPSSPYQRAIRGRARRAHNHVVTGNSEAVKLRMSKVPVGGNWRDIPSEYLGISVSHSCLYRRLDPARPSVTLGNFRKNMLIHPCEDRHLSLREAARLQSFPDDYYFDGPTTVMQQQIADATPPLLAEALGRSLLRLLTGKR